MHILDNLVSSGRLGPSGAFVQIGAAFRVSMILDTAIETDLYFVASMLRWIPVIALLKALLQPGAVIR